MWQTKAPVRSGAVIPSERSNLTVYWVSAEGVVGAGAGGAGGTGLGGAGGFLRLSWGSLAGGLAGLGAGLGCCPAERATAPALAGIRTIPATTNIANQIRLILIPLGNRVRTAK